MTTTYHCTRRTPDGKTKDVGPFKNARAAQRFIAQALVDNGYADRAPANDFARTISPTGGPQTHAKSGVVYRITQETS